MDGENLLFSDCALESSPAALADLIGIPHCVFVVVVAFSSLARIFGECLKFIPCLVFFVFFKWRLAHTH